VLNQGVQLRQAGRREAGDGIRQVRERTVRLQDPEVAHVRVHDQLHPQVEAPAGEVHDEQRARKFHNSSGEAILDKGLHYFMVLLNTDIQALEDSINTYKT